MFIALGSERHAAILAIIVSCYAKDLPVTSLYSLVYKPSFRDPEVVLAAFHKTKMKNRLDEELSARRLGSKSLEITAVR